MEDGLNAALANFGIEDIKEKLMKGLLEYAGKEREADGVVNMITLAIYDATNKIPDIPILHKVLRLAINNVMPAIIDAVVADNEGATAVKKLWATINND